MNKLLIILTILTLIVISGCTTTKIGMKSNPMYFDDTNSSVGNMKACTEAYEEYKRSLSIFAQASYYYKINQIVCDNGKCYCD